jgi:hypothetical protein
MRECSFAALSQHFLLDYQSSLDRHVTQYHRPKNAFFGHDFDAGRACTHLKKLRFHIFLTGQHSHPHIMIAPGPAPDRPIRSTILLVIYVVHVCVHQLQSSIVINVLARSKLQGKRHHAKLITG